MIWALVLIAQGELELREAALFGVDTATTATVSAAAPALAPELEPAAPAPMPELRETLAVGGLLFLQLDGGLVDHGDAGASGGADGLRSTLASPSFADVFLDARPSERLRAYVRGRVSFDASAVGGERSSFGQTVEPFGALLDQAWIKLDLARALFVTFGREKVKFGVGRFWNPTDFVNRERLDALSGVTVFDRRAGVGVLKLHLPIESLGWNLYAIGTLDGAAALDEPGVVLRAELLFGTTELALSGSLKQDAPIRVGLSVSSGVGWLDLRGEAALSLRSHELGLRGSCNVAQAASELAPGATGLPASLGETFDRADEVVPQLLAGAELSIPIGDEDTLIVGGEYLYNGSGYASSAYYPCLIARPLLAAALALTAPQPAFTPFYLGVHYAGGYALLQAPGRWDDSTFVLSGIGNLSDRSAVLRLDYAHRALTFLTLNAYVSGHLGARGGELSFAMRLPSVPAIVGAPAGLAELLRDGVPRPVMEAGLGLQLAL